MSTHFKEMRKLRRHIIVLMLVTLAMACPGMSFAEFEDTGAGARPIGMGNAFTAVADDANAVYYNPAALACVRQPMLTASYGQLFRGLSDKSRLTNNYFAYIQPTQRWGSFGVGLMNFEASGLLQEQAGILGYGFDVGEKLGWDSRILQLGTNIKLLRRTYASNNYTQNAINVDTGESRGGPDPVFSNGYGKSAMGLDISLVTKLDRFLVGLMLTDINKPDLGLKEESRVPLGVKLGLGYETRKSVIDLDIQQRDKDRSIALGGERRLMKNVFALRGGVGFGTRELRNFNLGASYRHGRLQIDYAFTFPITSIQDAGGNHRLGLTFYFDQKMDKNRYDIEVTPDESREMPQQKKKTMGEELAKAELIRQKNQHCRLALEYYRASEYQKAINEWNKALDLDPENPELFKLIEQAKQKLKDQNLAVKFINEDWPLQRIEQAKPEPETKKANDRQGQMKYYFGAGLAHYKNGQYDKAIEEFKKVLALDPKHPQSLRIIKKAREKLKAKKKSAAPR